MTRAVEASVFAVLMSTLLAASAVAEPTLAEAAADRTTLEKFLKRPFATFRKDRVPRGFRIIALSNLAEYCGRRRHEHCVRLAHGIAVDERLSPYGEVALENKKLVLGDHGLYLAHLGVILTELRQRFGTVETDPALHRLARHLRAATLASPNFHIASYVGRKQRYPADQAVVLYVLHRYDRIYKTDLADEPTDRWLAFMADQGSSADGLHRSEVTGAERWGRHARGCAMSWTIRYLAAFAPAVARSLWDRYVEQYETSAWLVAGFREWPRGIDRAPDLDSGPIVMGVGVAATAFAIGASRAVGDRGRHNRLVRTMNMVYAAGGQEAKRVGQTILARAIALNGTE